MPQQKTFAVRVSILVSTLLLLVSACGGGAADVVNPADPGGTGSTGGTGSGGSGGSGSPSPGTDVVTYKNDVARTGQNLTETTLTQTNVNSASFGLLRNLSVDGKVDAQPLYLSQLTIGGAAHNVVFVATEADSVYAFDSDTGATLWHVSLLPSGDTLSDAHGCYQVVPNIGITSTPVIDRHAGTNGVIYVVAMSKDQSSAYHQRLHALDVTTGAEMLNGPVEITGTHTAPGSVTTTFQPGQYAERAALLLSQGIVYTSWTSHCDVTPYGGWIMGYNQATLAQVSVLSIAPNSNAGPSIWMAGGGPGADSAGNIYVLAANGAFETTLDSNGFPNKQDYGNSFLKLATNGGSLAVADYFAMWNEVAESNTDLDLGSGGELVLPDLTDSTNTVRHLVVGAGKDGNIYLVNRDSMGKYNANSNNIWQELDGALPGGVYSTPAYYNGTLYYGDSQGTLKAFPIANAKLATMPASQSATQFSYPGTAPAVSANGTSNGIVWAHENTGSQAVLHAYDAVDLTHEIYNSNQATGNRDQFGVGNKFITPTIADGKVFVGTTNSVAVFGLLH
jgi:PQQ-like domain